MDDVVSLEGFENKRNAHDWIFDSQGIGGRRESKAEFAELYATIRRHVRMILPWK